MHGDFQVSDSPTLVDWGLAARTARRLVRASPEVTAEEAAEAVEQLLELSDEAESHVRGLTKLTPQTSTVPAVRIVDRNAWIDVNIDGMSSLITPLAQRLVESQERPSGSLTVAIGSRVTGAQAGAVLSFIASRVLGQYEIFGSGGELLLVAPNIVETERKLGVDSRDFRLWVCLHEVTHRLQFTAVPWLEGYLRDQIGAFVDATDTSADAVREQLGELVRNIAYAVRPGSAGQDDAPSEGLLALIKNPVQREILDRMTALMSLVEGHAEYVMDEVGPDVVPSVASIRKRFNQRRKGRGALDRILRRLLGLEAKMQQYAQGRHFVSGVVDEIGIDGFNAVWAGPHTLPTIEELLDPSAWVARVHGPRPALAS
ncbi:MAG: zinc-dependent metalloprotease [Geodermatophilaceae bacterium]|nr:zinc-dependent metalloprotease [Geodermatophilaceae bacterium]